MWQTTKPVYGIDLVAHPLAGNAGRIRPEQAVFQIFTRIKSFKRTVHQIPLPIHVGFFEVFDQLGPTPAARLIDVPHQFYHHNWAKFARFDVVICSVVIGTTAALRTNLYNFFGISYGFEYRPVVFHGFGQGLF